MKSLTLIPNSETYGLTLLLLLILSSFSLSSLIYFKWCRQSRFGIVDIHCIVKGIIVCFGLFLFPLLDLFYCSFLKLTLATITGIAIGFLHVNLEFFLSRKMFRKTLFQKETPSKTQDMHNVGTVKRKSLFSKQEPSSKEKETVNVPSYSSFSLSSVLLVAFLEEVLFRGFLLQYLFAIPSFFFIPALLLASFLFGASHLNMNNTQFLSKTLFSLSLFAEVILCKTLFASVLSHLVFNYLSYSHLQQLRRSPVASS